MEFRPEPFQRRAVAGVLLVAAFACAAPAQPEQAGAAAQPAAEQTVAPLVRNAEQSRASGDYDKAIEAYADAFGRTPWNTKLKRALAVTHSERAAAARTNGKLEPAEKDLRVALELYPDDAEFRHGLAVVLLERSSLEMDPARATAYREEVKTLAPDLRVPDRMVNPQVERKMDLAFESIERGQLDEGIAELHALRRDFPGEATSARLLAQALVRQGSELSERQNFGGARAALDEAVALYREIGPCDGVKCTLDELRVAHYNRVVAYVNLDQRADARTALEEAQSQGLRFPDLAEALSR